MMEGTMERKKSDEERYREALISMKQGNKKAKTRVAFYKLTGLGGAEVDADEAVVLLEERSRGRDNEARWMLGLCCEYGLGIEQDVKRAELLYRTASENGNCCGMFLLENSRGGRGSGAMIADTLGKFLGIPISLFLMIILQT